MKLSTDTFVWNVFVIIQLINERSRNNLATFSGKERKLIVTFAVKWFLTRGDMHDWPLLQSLLHQSILRTRLTLDPSDSLPRLLFPHFEGFQKLMTEFEECKRPSTFANLRSILTWFSRIPNCSAFIHCYPRYTRDSLNITAGKFNLTFFTFFVVICPYEL